MSIADLKHSLKGDDKWKRYRSLLASIKETFPVESLQQEIDTIQKLRKVRGVRLNGISANKLLDMSMDEVQHRARLTEVLIQARREFARLDALVTGMYSYIKGEYAQELSSFKSQADRNSAVETLLSTGYEVLSQIEAISDTVELVIKDIDQSSFTLTRVANLIELTTRREHVANITV